MKLLIRAVASLVRDLVLLVVVLTVILAFAYGAVHYPMGALAALAGLLIVVLIGMRMSKLIDDDMPRTPRKIHGEIWK